MDDDDDDEDDGMIHGVRRYPTRRRVLNVLKVNVIAWDRKYIETRML